MTNDPFDTLPPANIPKKKRSKRMTHKEKRFVKALLETGNKAEAVRRAGYSLSSVYKEADRLTRRPVVQQALRAILEEKEGLNDLIVTRLQELLEMPFKMSSMDEGITPGDFIKAAAFKADITGDKAPKNHQHIHAKLRLPIYKGSKD